MDDLLYARVLPLWPTSLPSAPEASVLSQLAQSGRRLDHWSWPHGAMAAMSVLIESPIRTKNVPVCPYLDASIGRPRGLVQRPLTAADKTEVML
jgi:hypothetical protein